MEMILHKSVRLQKENTKTFVVFTGVKCKQNILLLTDNYGGRYYLNDASLQVTTLLL